MAKKPTTAKKPAAKAEAKPDAAVAPRAARKAALAEEGSAHTSQTGMEPGPDTAAAAKAAKDQFAEADARGDPEAQAFEDLQVQRSVRGW